MNYSTIKYPDIANGPGVRVSLFVSGCRNHCPGCFNEETWDFNHGKEFTAHDLSKILDILRQPFVNGLSILGGDPFEPENADTVGEICYAMSLACPKKPIWVWTGYKYEDLIRRYPNVLKKIDVLVDGPFIESRKNLGLRFRGSENQRIIDIRKTMISGEVTLWKDPNADKYMNPRMN